VGAGVSVRSARMILASAAEQLAQSEARLKQCQEEVARARRFHRDAEVHLLEEKCREGEE
jgi:hypothetical protein